MSLHDVVKRRMANTGETEEEATRAVLEAFGEVQEDSDAPQDWTAGWERTDNQAGLEKAAQWLRARPPEIQALARRFPMRCLVRTKDGFHHQIPAAGKSGIVMGYGSATVVGVLSHPEGGFLAECSADALEVVGFCGGLTAEWVASVLDH
jgi:hypothetical protein